MLSRNSAFKEAKQKAGVPRSQYPDKVYKEKIRDQQKSILKGVSASLMARTALRLRLESTH
jgi:hypothetical protein